MNAFIRTQGAGLALFASIVLAGCSGGASDEPTEPSIGQAGSGMESPDAPKLSVEQALAEAELSPVAFDNDAMALAASRVNRGDALVTAMAELGPVLGAPQHSQPGVVNWLKRMDNGACGNLMLAVSDGVLTQVAYTEFPKGSMGEAKCQNWLR